MAEDYFTIILKGGMVLSFECHAGINKTSPTSESDTQFFRALSNVKNAQDEHGSNGRIIKACTIRDRNTRPARPRSADAIGEYRQSFFRSRFSLLLVR